MRREGVSDDAKYEVQIVSTNDSHHDGAGLDVHACNIRSDVLRTPVYITTQGREEVALEGKPIICDQ
jgi:hypothetical protein